MLLDANLKPWLIEVKALNSQDEIFLDGNDVTEFLDRQPQIIPFCYTLRTKKTVYNLAPKLQVNTAPDMSASSPLDKAIKGQVTNNLTLDL